MITERRVSGLLILATLGGALFLADKVFGGWLDKVTRIYYRVEGPWTSPRITVEDAE